MKNTKLEEQLLIKILLNLVIFKKLYLVKMCPIFDSSQSNSLKRYQKTFEDVYLDVKIY